jgi:hypothetical protein
MSTTDKGDIQVERPILPDKVFLVVETILEVDKDHIEMTDSKTVHGGI